MLSPPRIVMSGGGRCEEEEEAIVSQKDWGKFWLMQLPNAIRVRGSVVAGRGANSIVSENKDGSDGSSFPSLGGAMAVVSCGATTRKAPRARVPISNTIPRPMDDDDAGLLHCLLEGEWKLSIGA